MDASGPFNAREPLAYFLTWTTYGTWLPGDERGSNRKRDPAPLPSNPLFVEMARASLNEPAFTLSLASRTVVDQTIRRHCEVRNWVLHALTVRSNHVHVVVSAAGYPPDTVREQLKAWCSRNLKNIEPGRSKFWTEGRSSRWINVQADLQSAIVYVVEAQHRKGVWTPVTQARP